MKEQKMTTAMKLERWATALDVCAQQIQADFGGMDTAALNWKPTAAVWSIAQQIEHLIVINESYYPVVAQIRAGTYRLPFWGKWKWVQRFFGNLVLKAVLPTNQKKMKTFGIWEPSQSAISGDVIARFGVHHLELIAFMKSCADLLEQGQVLCSPASRSVVYTLETAFEIIVQHIERHREQACRLKEQLPKG